MLAPMRPRPIIPSCITDSFQPPIDRFFDVARLKSSAQRIPSHPIAPNQSVRRAVMVERWLGLTLELGDDPLRQHLAQLDAPLVERVDVPDDALGEHAVLVEGHEFSE